MVVDCALWLCCFVSCCVLLDVSWSLFVDVADVGVVDVVGAVDFIYVFDVVDAM